ncbi:MAG: N-acetylmuramoyl-L-alanine amidase [Bacteroidaceae bacterium]|nr:N-acetylmuramoyl-L-alanine amidase [Bacteroidaceae bacterium]
MKAQTIIRLITIIGLLSLAEAVCFSQNASVQSILQQYFSDYPLACSSRGENIKIENFKIINEQNQIRIFLNETFGVQPFTSESVRKIYDDIQLLLPDTYQSYRVFIYAKGVLIDDLVLGGCAEGTAAIRTWPRQHLNVSPWVTLVDRPYSVHNGLDGRHLSIWASHGIYYALNEKVWRWQRPRLYCTTEDLFTQTIVVPYLIPMLENAGAIVYTPRERDWQKREVIVDNDTPFQNGVYKESNGACNWTDAGIGFAHRKLSYLDGENPFTDGTVRQAETMSRQSMTSKITWTPDIPADGRYAVYVSYATLPTSVSDALYIVRHRGQDTQFRVNQQMGGGTWVYLGTFDFAAGNSSDNCVTLSNQSNFQGHVTADAVRFGGGMGNIARGKNAPVISGFPRFLEGARYSAQWAGMPYEVYANKNSENDYAEDINVRSHTINYLARGSEYQPGDSGLHVPIEMSIAVHSDAGASAEDNIIGTLGIYTTAHEDGIYPSGLSRFTSRDLCDVVVSQLVKDMLANYRQWTRRQMWDRNYSETREPAMPSMILEMLSHQNFADMRLAHDPNFKFTIARSIYKGILRANHMLHRDDNAVVQPLPVTAPAAYVPSQSNRIKLSWLAVDDPLEPSANATGFVVYHAVGDGDFDNGTYVNKASYTINNATPDVLHRFRITACNAGGQSMPSQEVCAYVPLRGNRQILIIDAFDRLAAPQSFENDSLLGFDLDSDPGVPMAQMPGFCGRQICFNRDGFGREGYGGLGYSTSELEGMIIAGNTLDWSTRHARDIIAATGGRVAISSCAQNAVGRANFDTRSINLIDIIFGLDKYDGYSYRQSKVFAPQLIQSTAEFVRSGGNLLVSGAFVGSDMTAESDRLFTRSILKYEYAGALGSDSISHITGLNTDFDIYRELNEQSYCVPAVDCLAPTNDAFCPMVYCPSGQSAAAAYQGSDYRCFTMGFPFESIKDQHTRVALLQGILQFLIP